jgi:hypothetical protein
MKEIRYGLAANGGIYYRISGIRSADTYVNGASARTAAARSQMLILKDGVSCLRPVPELAEW